MTKVEFVREEHIKGVAEKRRKCFKQKSSLLFSSSTKADDENTLWRKFGLLPVSKHHHNGVDEEMLVLEDLEYQLTAALREEEEEKGFQGFDESTDDVGDLSARTGMTQPFFS